VIDFAYAPSQKGIGSEGRVYSLRLAFSNTGDCCIIMHMPFLLCGCPVVVLRDCAHRGGALLLVWAIRNCVGESDFKDLCNRMPPNVHAVTSQVHMIHYMYPAPYTRTYAIQKKIEKAAKSKVSQSSDDADDSTDDIELEEENDREAQSRTTPLIDLYDEVRLWCAKIEESIAQLGTAHKYDLQLSLDTSVKAAEPEKDPGYKIRQHIRFANQDQSVKEGKAPKTVYGYYCREYAISSAFSRSALFGGLRNHMNDPYKQIYPTNDDGDGSDSDDEDGADDFNFDGDYTYVGDHSEDSDEDGDYIDSDGSD